MTIPDYMRCSPGYDDALWEINRIIKLVRQAGDNKPGAVLYLGHNQYLALRTIEAGDLQEMRNNEFCGRPVVRVMKDDWLRLAV